MSFWEAWPRTPRKASKGKCLGLWRKQGLEGKASEIIAHVQAMKQTDSWRKGFDPAPCVYLKDERWDGAEVHSIEMERRLVI